MADNLVFRTYDSSDEEDPVRSEGLSEAAGAAVIDVSAAEAGLAAGWALVKLMLVVRVLTWARCSGLS